MFGGRHRAGARASARSTRSRWCRRAGRSLLSTSPKCGAHRAAVVADDAEAAGDDVGVGDEHLLDAVEPRDGDLVQDVEVAHQRAQARARRLCTSCWSAAPASGALTTRLRRSGSTATSVSVTSRRFAAQFWIAERLATWVPQHRLAVVDQLQRLRQRLLGAGQQQVAVVDQPAEVVAGAVEGLARARRRRRAGAPGRSSRPACRGSAAAARPGRGSPSGSAG